jgi:Fe-Mn family superoxide dismutase
MNKMENAMFINPLNRRQFLRDTIAGTALLAAGFMGLPSILDAASPQSGIPPFRLPPLPYGDDALSPYISARTIGFHYGKHHQGYIDKTNGFIQNTEFAKAPLEEIIKQTAKNPDRLSIFNNAAQAWNHTFYWHSMKPNGGGAPTGNLALKIEADFGNLDNFKKAFSDAATTQFGSGWAWLVEEGGSLKVVKTGNADTPLAHRQIPLITIDVWEHAYYLDYQNKRSDYIAAFFDHLVNWDFAAANFAKTQ